MRRRRECLKCSKRFTTYERAEGVDIRVVKKSGKVEDYDREKLKRGVMKATWKRPVSMEQVEEMLDEIEKILRRKTSTEVRSWEVGNLDIEAMRLSAAKAGDAVMYADMCLSFCGSASLVRLLSRYRALPSPVIPAVLE